MDVELRANAWLNPHASNLASIFQAELPARSGRQTALLQLAVALKPARPRYSRKEKGAGIIPAPSSFIFGLCAAWYGVGEITIPPTKVFRGGVSKTIWWQLLTVVLKGANCP
jgi:hypothetical protein